MTYYIIKEIDVSGIPFTFIFKVKERYEELLADVDDSVLARYNHIRLDYIVSPACAIAYRNRFDRYYDDVEFINLMEEMIDSCYYYAPREYRKVAQIKLEGFLTEPTFETLRTESPRFLTLEYNMFERLWNDSGRLGGVRHHFYSHVSLHAFDDFFCFFEPYNDKAFCSSYDINDIDFEKILYMWYDNYTFIKRALKAVLEENDVLIKAKTPMVGKVRRAVGVCRYVLALYRAIHGEQ